MWYVFRQRAEQIREDRQREADQFRLARLAESRETFSPRPPWTSTFRRRAARASLAVGRLATRVADALDSEVVRA